MAIFFIKLNVSYEKWENQFSQVLPVFVSCPISGDVHGEVSLLPVACDSSSASHTLLEAGIVGLKAITLPRVPRRWLSKYVHVHIRTQCQLPGSLWGSYRGPAGLGHLVS